MALFISDCHLGNRRCRADRLCALLDRHADAASLYLVGDIIDDRQMRRWPQPHRAALRKLLAFSAVRFVPGNHDGLFRGLSGTYGHVQVSRRARYVAGDGKKYLVVHGDEHDWMMRWSGLLPPWLIAALGWLGPLHEWAMHGVFRRSASSAARRCGYAGVICGHNHTPAIVDVDGFLYVNCGDWLSSCSAVIERGGRFALVSA